MNYYIDVFKKFADFSGRSRRSEFWYFFLFHIIALFAAALLDGIWGYPILYGLYALIAIVPYLAVGVRRLHDTGRSGWWFLIGLIPFVGGIILIVFWATDSQPGSNQWGPNPKEIGDDIADHLVQ